MAKMPRNEPGIGGDSFLDVITNVVGIVILLVMVVGLRVRQTPPRPVDAELTERMAAAQAAAAEAEADVLRIRSRLHVLEAEQSAAQAAIGQLSAQALAEESHIQAAAQNQLRYQTEVDQARRSLLELKEKYQGLELELRKFVDIKPTLVQIESYPTPLGRDVNGPEAHFQLLGGRVVHVPFEELKTLLEADVYRKISNLKNSPELSAVVGPIRGFSLSYVVKRPESASYAFLQKVTFVPESDTMGETLEEALKDHSTFRAVLNKYVPRLTVVTLWTYPDSFAEYRRLKKELYQAGFSVAGRPLPFGQLITGSPHGSRSAAQ